MPYKDPNKQKEAVIKSRKNKLQWFVELKRSLKCSRCSFSHPAALEFHHRDPLTKISGVTDMVFKNVSRELILQEIDKCDVLCSNCHRIEHSTLYD